MGNLSNPEFYLLLNKAKCTKREIRNHPALLIFLSMNNEEKINATPNPFIKSPIESGTRTSGLINKGNAIANVPRSNNQRVCFFMI